MKTDGGSYHVNETINRRTGAINRIQKTIKQNKLTTNQPVSTQKTLHMRSEPALLKLHF